MTEKPLVTIGEIAAFLNVSPVKAAKMLKEARVQTIPAYRPLLAITPGDLLDQLKRAGHKKDIENISQ